MEVRQLRTFLAVSRSLSFTRAAADLDVAQPAVSQSIARLEAEVGETLFRRSRAGVRLTAAGYALLPHAHAVADAVAGAEHAIATRQSRVSGALRLGVAAGVDPLTTAEQLAALHDTHPAITVQMTSGRTAELVAGCDDGTLDAALVVTPAGGLPERLSSRRLRGGRMLLRVSADHPWAARAQVPLTELKGHRIAGFGRTPTWPTSSKTLSARPAWPRRVTGCTTRNYAMR